jgi:hypothetical protein
MLKEIKVTWKGETALIMHRGELADPLDHFAKAISRQAKIAKKQKTESEYATLYRLEWEGSLYIDPKIGIVIPADNILKAIIEGARRAKLGKAVEASVFVRGIDPLGHHEVIKLIYEGPQETDPLWKNSNFVFKRTLRVGKNRLVRCRPIFRQWSVTFLVRFDTDMIDLSALIDAMRVAGERIGLGDWRPRYGTFQVQLEEAKK